MKIDEVRALITGGAGGIGSAIGRSLLERRASVLLVDIDVRGLAALAGALGRQGELQAASADLTAERDRAALVRQAESWGANVLINNAGLNRFGLFAEQSTADIAATIAVNVQAPLLLCHDMLPQLMRLPAARIVNIGSVFGAVGYPGYAAYSASKFAIRGYSEALRRELAASSVKVHYVAPRATRTASNGPEVVAMNEALGVRMDTVERVAREVCGVLEAERSEHTIGWPEKLFARLNGVLPALVDRAIFKQLPVIFRHARESGAANRLASTPDDISHEIRRIMQ